MVLVEAMASGRPVIARRKGGAVDSIVHGSTGILYDDATVDGLVNAILQFEQEEGSFKPDACVNQASKFSIENFSRLFSEVIKRR